MIDQGRVGYFEIVLGSVGFTDDSCAGRSLSRVVGIGVWSIKAVNDGLPSVYSC